MQVPEPIEGDVALMTDKLHESVYFVVLEVIQNLSFSLRFFMVRSLYNITRLDKKLLARP
jgi:hypothetical protein